MSVNGVNSVTSAYDVNNASKAKQSQSEAVDKAKQNNQSNQNNAAAVYEKSDTTAKGKVYQRDTATIEKLMAESERRTQGLRDLVRKMLLEQGETYNETTDIYGLLREGKLKVDPKVREQAQKDIAEGGYWSVEETSERLLSFAKALSGGDSAKADEMIEAVKKGFDMATKDWGGELPDISKRTLEATIKKLEAWRDSLNPTKKPADAASNEFAGQAAADKIAK